MVISSNEPMGDRDKIPACSPGYFRILVANLWHGPAKTLNYSHFIAAF